jgi:hypothetical protein
MRKTVPFVRLELCGHVDYSSAIFTSSRMRI